MLHHACQQFLGMTESQVKSVIISTLEGHQRSIMGTMSGKSLQNAPVSANPAHLRFFPPSLAAVEEIYQDRSKFNEAVFNVASRDLANMGMTVISYTLQSIADEVG